MGDLQDPTAQFAFEALVSSYLISRWQRAHGTRHSLGSLDWIRFSYEVAGRRRLADLFFVSDLEPAEVVSRIRGQDPADNHLILTLASRHGLVTEYMSAGCSYLTPPSYLMARRLDEFQSEPSDHEIILLSAADQVGFVEAIEGADPVYPADLEDPALSHYVAYIDRRPAAVARLSRLDSGISWVSHVYTATPFRSLGVATSLMSRLMHDSYESGERSMYLLATEEAHSLYRHLGFLDLGAILNFILL
jgi:GNAT superfamily N-acetyltransferase